MPDIDLRALLEEVPYEALHSYFETNNIPLPKDGSKDKLIDLLLTQEYKKDVRAALLVELKAACRMFTSELKDSSEKIKALSADVDKKHTEWNGEVEKKYIVTEHWKHVFQLVSFTMGIVVSALGFTGWSSVKDFQVKLDETEVSLTKAQHQLENGRVIIDGYRGFVLNEVSRSVSSIMDQVNTKWFTESDKYVADELEVYIDNLKKFNEVDIAHDSSDEGDSTKKEITLIIAFLKLLEPIARSPLSEEHINTPRFQMAEQNWTDLQTKWKDALSDKSVSDVTAKTYLAYIANIQGVFSHVKYSAASKKGATEATRKHLENSKKYFEASLKFRSGYAPASSNLGVALLNMLSLKIMPGNGFGSVTEKEFDSVEELLNTAMGSKQLSTVTKARIYNNLAMNSMYMAFYFASMDKTEKAVECLNKADTYLNNALRFPDTPSVVEVSKAEISSYRIVLMERRSEDSSQAKSEAKRWMREAIIKNYQFNNVQMFVDNSPLFSALQQHSPAASREIWGGVNSQR
jgi:hypothetical protein